MTAIMTFNGVDLSRYLRITEIIRPIGNKRSVTTDDAPSLGVNIQQVKRGAKEHIIKFDMKNSDVMILEQLKHELAGVLDVTAPVKIVYGDEPDKYYMGIPVDDITPDNLTRWFQRSEFKLLIPDGVAHSSTYRKFDNATVTGEKMVLNLRNDGNVPANPIITVKHNAENGYIGIVNSTGAIELGNIEEEDSQTYQQSEILFDYVSNNGIIKGFADGKKNVAILNDNSQSFDTNLYVKNEFGRPHLALGNRGAGVGPNHAGSISWDIPLDSAGQTGALNEYIWWRQIFWAGAVNQYGFIKVMVSDEKGQFLYGVETYKRSIGVESEYNFLASDGKGGFNVLKRWTFNATHLDSDNPFNAERGWSDIKRNDDQVQVFWWGSYPVFTIPEIKGKKSAKIHVSIGAVGGKPAIHHAYIDSIVYRKDFVQGTKDIPNRYMIGSNVVVNCENDSVTVDGLSKSSDLVDGSSWRLSIPKGESQLEIYCSSWVRNKPTVKVEFEERWL
ncbi:TPA: phage tail family protein [Streptococcus suis]|uniref:distal tail protein Dit n=1 Tax=Streptococcus suis TaxID=1307 RepID=UPI00209C23C2|nr:distal tail protein Dit [Streptococcus suis]MCO8220603.1 phage tail family protein [Streptococcus suis]HEM3511950.1 phage tail family protein [Streptococcus suis]